jgi:flavin reductase (DIM6/NTAB) family NADH-FMN oxidoreductase RutF
MGRKEVELKSFRSPMGNVLPITGHLVIVTTISKNGSINAAVKSDLMRMVSEPPIIAFSCNLSHHTAQNILEQHEFVVNIPGEDILEQAMETAKDYPREVNELEKAGLTTIPSVAVGPPRIKECPVHLECTKEWHNLYGDEIIIFGRVVSMSANEDIVNAPCEVRYRKVLPILTLGEGLYALLGEIKRLPNRQ